MGQMKVRYLFIFTLIMLITSCGNQQSNKILFEEKNKSIASVPLPPQMPPQLVKLKHEVDALNEVRQKNIALLKKRISSICQLKKSDRLVLRLAVSPSGEILSHKLLNINTEKIDLTNADCIKNYLNESANNLGEVKIIPSARNGSKPYEIPYTILLYDTN